MMRTVERSCDCDEDSRAVTVMRTVERSDCHEDSREEM